VQAASLLQNAWASVAQALSLSLLLPPQPQIRPTVTQSARLSIAG
jgi:hypothetical protein